MFGSLRFLPSKISKKLLSFVKNDKAYSKDYVLLSIRKEVEKIIQNKTYKSRPKIMYGPTFSLFEPCQVYDFLFSQSLVLRGAEIVPVSMGNLIENGESSFFGGVWGKFSDDPSYNKIQEEKNYKQYVSSEGKLWNEWSGTSPVMLSDYLNDKDIKRISDIVAGYSLDNYKQWSYDGLPVGEWALDVLRNNYTCVNERLIKDYKRKLKELLFNVITCVESLKRVVDGIKPDIIISNDSFYYPWSILEKLAQRKFIPFYSNWVPVNRKGASACAMGGAAMGINLKDPWVKWKQMSLSTKEERFVDGHLNKRKKGGGMVINTAEPSENNPKINNENISNENINYEKPTALLVSNIIWDLAALNKDVQFSSMMDWIFEVVRFFEKNSQWQLIIKPHPAEENQYLPLTKQRIKGCILDEFKSLPKNIFLLDATTNLTVYDFFDYIKMGLVYTSTSGLELACNGIPVLTSAKAPYQGKGFTYDTQNKDEYFSTLELLFKSNMALENKEKYSKLAKKFFLLQNFHYYMQIGFFDYFVGKKDGLKLRVSGAKDLLPSANLELDYLCDSILNKLPIVSEDRWPPFNQI